MDDGGSVGRRVGVGTLEFALLLTATALEPALDPSGIALVVLSLVLELPPVATTVRDNWVPLTSGVVINVNSHAIPSRP